MKTISVFPNFYSFSKNFVFFQLKRNVEREFLDLDVNVTCQLESGGFIKLFLEGPDEEAAFNFIKSMHVIKRQIDTLEPGQNCVGRCMDVGKHGFGLFIDIGLRIPNKKDALLPLHELRNKLVKNQKIPLRTISRTFGFVDGLPLKVKIERIESKKSIFLTLAPEQVNIYEKWVRDGKDRLIVCGTTFSRLHDAIKKFNQHGDIHSIDPIGLFEFILTCKEDTSARGMLPIIGRLIPASMSIFSPKNVKNWF
ncbi:MAG: DUF2110 family protein [Candidatus Helarchaeales archaeon]